MGKVTRQELATSLINTIDGKASSTHGHALLDLSDVTESYGTYTLDSVTDLTNYGGYVFIHEGNYNAILDNIYMRKDSSALSNWDAIYSGVVRVDPTQSYLNVPLIAGKSLANYKAIAIEWNEGGGGNSTSYTRKITLCKLGTTANSYSTVGEFTYTDTGMLYAVTFYVVEYGLTNIRFSYGRQAGMPNSPYAVAQNIYIHKIWGIV